MRSSGNSPDLEIRKYIGQRIRARRRTIGTSQIVLGDAISVTAQQIQKYEKGADRIASERLYRIAVALQTSPVNFFPACNGVPALDDFSELIGRQDTIRLLRAWQMLKSQQRAFIIEMIEGTGQQLLKKTDGTWRWSSQPAGHHHQ